MKIRSIIKDKEVFRLVEVEVLLSAGLPQIQLVGLPDQVVKESAVRIRAALKKQGFVLPKAQTILVNFRPAEIRKSSLGLELAVACAILLVTEQIDLPFDPAGKLFYGEISLEGDVYWSEQIPLHQLLKSDWELVSGFIPTDSFMHPPVWQIASLKDLASPVKAPALVPKLVVQAPLPKFKEVSIEEAEILKVCALGRHSLLLAGSHGSGKSSIAELLHSLSEPPSSEEAQSWSMSEVKGDVRTLWRPFVRPHHSTPINSLLGGGYWGRGEIVKAHQGILYLDEFFEFTPRVLEALRQPIEEKVLRVARSGTSHKYECNFHLVATTNLCPCGDWTPGARTKCSYNLLKCRSYQGRVTGPLLDRFQLLVFKSNQSRVRTVSIAELQDELAKVRTWRLARGFTKPAADWEWEELRPLTNRFLLDEILPTYRCSDRRKLSLLRLARTFADLEQTEVVEREQFNKAHDWAYKNFEALKAWGE